MKNTFPALKYWIIAMRPWSFPASIMPALIAFTYVFFLSHHQTLHVNWVLGILAILGAVIFQISGNLISDYFDYIKGVDREDTLGSGKLIVNHIFPASTLLYYGILHLLIATALGLYLYSQTGFALLIIGFLGTISALFYYYFKSKALGDLLIFTVYGPLIMWGVFYVMTGQLDWRMLAISLPISCITVGILHANNTRDIMHDKRANIKTLAMILGIPASIMLYKLLMTLAYALILFLIASKTLHWATVFVFITLPLAWHNCKFIEQAKENAPENIENLDVKTAQLQLSFSTLLSGLLVVSAWL